jgi:putative addiction module component (TIGR02574 family)
MSPILEKLREEALALPQEERLELADSLYVSLDADGADFQLHPSWDAEIERRVEELRSGKVQGIPAEDVFREIDALVDRA